MKLSKFGEKFTSRSGILSLMDDLGNAAGGANVLMLGGGNPAIIPEVQNRFRERMQRLLDDPKTFESLIGAYDPPEGDKAFRDALAGLLRDRFGWHLDAKNIGLTNGSQSAFFMLFNLLGGFNSDGYNQQIVLPVIPEYIGYADVGIGPDLFHGCRPTIEFLDQRQFKYRVDFESLELPEHCGAMCVSRPTNPTGNVLTDTEITHLAEVCRSRDIPLIIDNAYGTPFPNIVFNDASALWGENIIVTMSLSKFGLPGLRTGIVVADESVITALGGINAIVNLTTGGAGAALAYDLVRSGEILSLSTDVINPFYQKKADEALQLVRKQMRDIDVFVHKPEGTFFLWLWFRHLPITCQQLYERLKQRGVLVVAGHHFFPGLGAPWQHQHECIRINISQEPATVRAGIEMIAEEAKTAYHRDG